MSLQRKFFLVVSMLSLALLGSLGAVWWVFGVLQRDLTTPFSRTTQLLNTLGDLKQLADEQSAFLYSHGHALPGENPPPRPKAGETPSNGNGSNAIKTFGPRGGPPRLFTPTDTEMARSIARRFKAIKLMGRIESDDATTALIGVNTWRTLRTRVDEAVRLENAWFLATAARNDGPEQADAAATWIAISELVERSEAQVLASAKNVVTYGDTVRPRLWRWLISVFAAGLLCSMLAVALLRRWVLKPVRNLRRAAARIAEGDYQYRVPVRQRDELGRLSSEVNHMAEMVRVMQDERVERERLVAVGEMMRRVVHNVRNPLAGIRGLAEVTRLDMEPSSPNRESMDLIVSTVDAFERWLSDLLDATSPAAIKPCQIRVPEWIAGIVEIHRSQAAARNVTVHLDASNAPSAAVFDPKHMDHALSALLSNAIEATPSGGEVWVTARTNTTVSPSLSGGDRGGENGTLPTWEMHVVDRGAGIPPEILPHVFQPNFTTKPRGNGLGLAMAQQIVKGHSGRITVKNGDPAHPERCGASFLIRLPIQPAGMDPNNGLSKP